MLQVADTSTLFNLPEDFMGFQEAIEPVLAATNAAKQGAPSRTRPKPIEDRFADFVDRERASWSGPSPFALADSAAAQFFDEQGALHGTRTVNHQCGREFCEDTACCKIEYNFGTIQTYADRLAADPRFEAWTAIFGSQVFNRHMREGAKRQQTDGRFPLPAPPILEGDAEAIAAEGRSAVFQHQASFSTAGTDAAAADAAFRCCRDAQALVMFTFDLATGRRAHDIASTQTKDVFITGSTPARKVVVMNKTAKVLLPASVYTVREQSNSDLCPVAALDNYLAVTREYGVHIGPVSNGDDDTTLCSPYLFPFLVKDSSSGYPVVTPSRAKRGGSVSSGWEKVPTQQCNAWLKRMLVRLDGSVNTAYTFHGTRVVAALVSLAAGRQLQTINKTMNWADGSNQANAYARFLQMQHMCQEPVLRDNIAATVQTDYASFFSSK